jgi:hypothetical protein
MVQRVGNERLQRVPVLGAWSNLDMRFFSFGGSVVVDTSAAMTHPRAYRWIN